MGLPFGHSAASIQLASRIRSPLTILSGVNNMAALSPAGSARAIRGRQANRAPIWAVEINRLAGSLMHIDFVWLVDRPASCR